MSKLALTIMDMPFCLGAMATPKNPAGLPNVYPFRLEINTALGRLEQAADDGLDVALGHAYRVGNEMGTPSDNTELGRPYVEDFMRFIDQSSPDRGALLEIGAGTGFMSKCLAQAGWQVSSIEPGRGYQDYWQMHGVQVVNDFFPSDQICGQFDAIVFYTVLEHIKDTKAFLNSVKRHLKPAGKIILAVPDCTDEIEVFDPSILLHEHFHYFTSESLENTLAEAGFAAAVEIGRFGRSLFAVGILADSNLITNVSQVCTSNLEKFTANIQKVRSNVQESLAHWLELGEVGIYCPSRLLNFLPVASRFLFYDDAVAIQGKYYPPFESPVGSRAKLFVDSPKTLLIGSRTFGAKLKSELLDSGLKSSIVLLSELT